MANLELIAQLYMYVYIFVYLYISGERFYLVENIVNWLANCVGLGIRRGQRDN